MPEIRNSNSARTKMPSMLVLIFVLAIGLADCIHAADERSNPIRSRREFAKAMNKVEKGMSQANVRSLLGRPDDVRTDNDPGGVGNLKEIWRYGTSGYLTMATLGQVFFDRDGLVDDVLGKGKPPLESLPQEVELRRLLSILDNVPSYVEGRYNPRHVILAVNALQPLGKDKALAIVDEYLRVTFPGDDFCAGTIVLLRVLFEVPPNPREMPYIGGHFFGLEKPEYKVLLPRLPIAVEQDIPFLLTNGYMVAGRPPAPNSHFAYYREHGKLRAKPLRPPDKPFEAFEAFASSPRWIFKEENERNQSARHLLEEQILRLLDSVCRVEPDAGGNLLPWGDERRRRQILKTAANLKIRWDAKQDRYTFLDGKSLADVNRRIYRRETWKPDIASGDVQLIVERIDSKHVGFLVEEKYATGKPPPRLLITVFKVGSRDEPLASFRTGVDRMAMPGESIVQMQEDEKTTTVTRLRVELTEGSAIQAELTSKNPPLTSPVYKP